MRVAKLSARVFLLSTEKFAAALLLACLWVAFSIWVSIPWLNDLVSLTNWLAAIFVLTFIAYLPGFMNVFLLTSLILDRRPPRCVPSFYPGVTVLIAAYNEEDAIGSTLSAIAGEKYPGELEVILLNDGSSDQTVSNARSALASLDLPKNATFRILDNPHNQGKAQVLNEGLKLASHDLIVTIDADSRLLADSLTRLINRLLCNPNQVAVAGAVLVANARDSIITGAQEGDYFLGIAAVKRMQSMYKGTLVAQGAYSVYRRDALLEVGGWPECVGEDIVLTWALLRKGYEIGYAEDAIIFTNAPTSLRQFALQRKRWSRGLVEAFFHHGCLLWKPRLTMMFIWWNLLFLPLDFTFTFVFAPGIIAALFGYYWLAGLMTLLILPLAALWNVVVFRIQTNLMNDLGLELKHSKSGLLFYMLFYPFIMQPVSLWGYAAELLGMKKSWGTK
jgi:poly-beta-1,6-N-acetyl-D-glucosamine synthase